MQFILKNSNYEIEIIPSSLKEACNLKKAAFECLKEAGIIKDIKLTSLNNLDLAMLIDKLFEVLLNAEISNNFEKALFKCLENCTITVDEIKRKINPQLFDEIMELREDYYEIISKCTEVNLRPFFKSLYGEFQTRLNHLTKEDPQLNSMEALNGQ